MKTLVRASCDHCGDISIPIDYITVRVCRDADLHAYTLTCPRCARPIARESTQITTDLLHSAGAPRVLWSFPAELAEDHAGLPISPDDVLDFALALGAQPTAHR